MEIRLLKGFLHYEKAHNHLTPEMLKSYLWELLEIENGKVD